MRTSPFLVTREPKRDRREHYNVLFMVVDAASKTHALEVAKAQAPLFAVGVEPNIDSTYKKPEVVAFETGTIYRR